MCIRDSPRGLRFENEDDLLLSKIYDWYADDFGDNEKELLQHLMRYANQSTKARLESFDGDIDYEYDWDLNGVSRRVADFHLRTTQPE